MAQEKITRAHEFAPEYKFSIVNFEEKTIDITDLVHSFNIYENLFENVTTCDLIIKDAMGLIDGMPIVGDEYITLSYRTAGFKTVNGNQEEFKTVFRSFRVYKIGDRVESSERQQNYILHCVDDHLLLNEMIDINQSFVGQNAITACDKMWESNFIKTSEEFRPFNKGGSSFPNRRPKLYGVGTDPVIESRNSTDYIAPGITPFEVIMYLKEEAQHKENNNVSDYVFYQDLDGFHLTTITELKRREPIATFQVQDPAVEKKNNSITDDDGQSYPLILRTIVEYNVKKTFDTINNLGIGLYGNRVAALDLLTKRFDEKTFSYMASADQLEPMDVGKINPDNSLFRFSGSTHTRFIATELTTSSVNTGNPTNFSGGQQYEKANKYLYPVGESGGGGSMFMSRNQRNDKPANEKKEEGTIKNSDADKRLQSIKSGDKRVANPRSRHELLNRRVSGKGILDNIMISFVVPGNSDLTVGQTILVYLPQNLGNNKNTTYSVMFGTKKANQPGNQNKPKFIITSLRQTYQQGQSSYSTVISAVKDSLGDTVETIRKKATQGQT